MLSRGLDAHAFSQLLAYLTFAAGGIWPLANAFAEGDSSLQLRQLALRKARASFTRPALRL